MRLTIGSSLALSAALNAALLGASLLLPARAGDSEMSKAMSEVGGMMQGGNLGSSEIVSGLRQALSQGTTSAISQLGRSDGFWKDPSVRIPLPGEVSKFESGIRMVGGGKTLDQFQLTMNRAAEAAVPKAAGIIGNSISQMSVSDAKSILNGPNDAATQYFKRTASKDLFASIKPIVAQATQQAGVTQQYKKLTDKAGPVMSLTGSSAPDLDGYVTQKAMDGLFVKIAAEEARIRTDPAARGTDLMKKVFASAAK